MTSTPDAVEPVTDWRACPPVPLTPILDAALAALYEHGYHGTTVRDIARRADLTVPALYYHHENKQAILFALMDAAIERSVALCQQAVAEAHGDPEPAFVNLVEALVRFMATSGKMAFLDSEIRSLTAEHRETYAAKRAVVEQLVLSTIEDGVEAGIFRVTVPQTTARALLGMIQQIPLWYRPRGPLSVDGVVAQYVDIAVHTVGATPEVLDRHRSA